MAVADAATDRLWALIIHEPGIDFVSQGTIVNNFLALILCAAASDPRLAMGLF